MYITLVNGITGCIIPFLLQLLTTTDPTLNFLQFEFERHQI